jgi:F420-dependent oxidoreductase-like protein
MRLGLHVGYWGLGLTAEEQLKLVRDAESVGFDSVWAAEAYGSDTATVLAWLAANTEKIKIGSAIFQIPGRSPAMTAMTAATLDNLSDGRVILGIGSSGPQVAEGWHGQRFAKQLTRTREYVAILRKALARERLEFDGEIYELPLPDGPGKALQLTVHPVREHIPIYLASVGPKNLELTGEIADGWLAIFFSTDFAAEQLALISAGRAKVGKDLDGFDVVASVPLVIGRDGADLQALADPIRGYAALYIGGMGSKDVNFYNQLAIRMGYVEEAAEIQSRYLARDYAAAATAVPFQFIDSTSLLGSPARIAERMAEFAAAGVTTLNVMPYAGTLEERLTSLRTAAEALRQSGVAS